MLVYVPACIKRIMVADGDQVRKKMSRAVEFEPPTC